MFYEKHFIKPSDSFSNLITKKVTIYDNTLNSVVTKFSHFQLDINNIYNKHLCAIDFI